MRASNPPLTRLVLVLIMIILVLLSLFWFLYQGWEALAEQAQQAEVRATRINTLETELGQNRDALLSAQSTRTALEEELAEKILEHQTAERETIAEQREKESLATRVAELSAELEATQPTIQLPLTAVIQPFNGASLPVNQTAPLVIVAADSRGLASVVVSGLGEEVTQLLNGETIYTLRQSWTPREVGTYTLVITAVNTVQLTSQPISVTVNVVEGE